MFTSTQGTGIPSPVIDTSLSLVRDCRHGQDIIRAHSHTINTEEIMAELLYMDILASGIHTLHIHSNLIAINRYILHCPHGISQTGFRLCNIGYGICGM